jgi:hypothetical protein
MLTKEEAHHFAEHWLTAWNAHDLDQIMAHYPVATAFTTSP